MAITPKDLKEMGHMFDELSVPVLYIQEGGYLLEVMYLLQCTRMIALCSSCTAVFYA